MKMLEHYINEFRSGRDVAPGDAEALFKAIIMERDEMLLVSLLEAWNNKGTSEGELFAFATIMRNRMKRITSRHTVFVDAVGTGGSTVKTFNVSTAAAFVIAGAGVAVAKHGNRAATSSSGSADVLSLLGVNVDIEPESAEHCLDEIGICFMFAPRFHSLSPALAAARRQLGRPTIFNNLGPLCNPASAPHQVLGVWDRNLLEKTARVLARLGTGRSWIVHAENGLDEIALTGKTCVAEIKGGEITQFEIGAGDFGLDSVNSGDLPSRCSAEDSASIIREILDNASSGDASEKLVLINAAAAIYVAGHAPDLPASYKIAEESIRSGAAQEKLARLAWETHR